MKEAQPAQNEDICRRGLFYNQIILPGMKKYNDPRNKWVKLPFEVKGYNIIKKLGEGAYGSVYEAYHLEGRKKVALKFFFMEDDPLYQYYLYGQSAIREMAALHTMRRDPHTITALENRIVGRNTYMITLEWMPYDLEGYFLTYSRKKSDELIGLKTEECKVKS